MEYSTNVRSIKVSGPNKCCVKNNVGSNNWVKKWSHCTLLVDHSVYLGYGSCKFGSLCFCDYIDHPVSYDYGSPCIMWLWITSYSLTNTNDHSASFDNGQPSIGGCCPISQVGQIRNFNNWKHIQVGGSVGLVSSYCFSNILANIAARNKIIHSFKICMTGLFKDVLTF